RAGGAGPGPAAGPRRALPEPALGRRTAAGGGGPPPPPPPRRAVAWRARARAPPPGWTLMKAPLGALDKKLRDHMKIELKRLQREVGITTIYVTHDQEEALTMSDRIAVMHRGRVEQVAAPRGLYETPATAFVAGFIGNINLLAGRAAGANAVACGGAT